MRWPAVRLAEPSIASMLWAARRHAHVNPPQGTIPRSGVSPAGSLVNVALSPILWCELSSAGRLPGWAQSMPDAYHFLWMVLLSTWAFSSSTFCPFIRSMRPNSSISALVLYRLRVSLRRNHCWICGRGGVGLSRSLRAPDAVHLVIAHRRLHVNELLERIQERASHDSPGKTVPRWRYLLAPVAEQNRTLVHSGNARNAAVTSTRLRLGLFAPTAELNFPTRCVASAKNRIPLAIGWLARMQITPKKSAVPKWIVNPAA